jgi:hypothetical protein
VPNRSVTNIKLASMVNRCEIRRTSLSSAAPRTFLKGFCDRAIHLRASKRPWMCSSIGGAHLLQFSLLDPDFLTLFCQSHAALLCHGDHARGLAQHRVQRPPAWTAQRYRSGGAAGSARIAKPCHSQIENQRAGN